MKSSIGSLKRLYFYIRPHKFSFAFSLLMVTIASFLNAIVPILLGFAFTEIGKNLVNMAKGIGGINFPYVMKISIIFLVVGILTQVAQYLSIFFMTNVVQGSMKALRADVSRKINKIPISYFDKRKQGDILSTITNDVDAISNALQQSLIQVFTAILGIIFAIVMMFYISIPMALITSLMVPVSILISKTIIKRSQKYFVNQQEALGELNGFISENYNGFDVIKLYEKEEDSIKEFNKINNRLINNGVKATFLSGIMMPLTGAITNMAYISMAILGSYYAIIGVITLGNMQAFIQYVWQVNQPISQITQLSNIIQTASAATSRIFDFLDVKEEVEEFEALPLNIEGNVEFKDVSFGYSNDNILIKSLNFSVKKGQKVAIVGPTGAGKTTLINLLMRFYDITEGSIEIDSINTKSISRGSVRSAFGMVLQDAWLYSTSIRENIAFGKLDATDEEIKNAAKSANVHDYIMSLPKGYDTVLNEDTSNISQGQKQLITIARAIIKNPSILILDEATSSVDTRLEALIQKAMTSVMKGRTSFVIAHRLSTIKDADIILVMNNGDIVEKGNHEELLEKKGFYEKLYNSQFANS